MNEEVLSQDKERLLTRITDVKLRILEQKENIKNAKGLSTFCYEVQFKSLRAHLKDLIGQAIEAGYLYRCSCGDTTLNKTSECDSCVHIRTLIEEA